MTADKLSALAGIVLSLLFSYVPKLKDWYGNLDGDYKRLIMLGALVVVSVGVFALTCWGVVDVGVICTEAGFWGLVGVFFDALVLNQAAYLLTPKNGKK